jgi:Zn-finger nucleic acid-binding protein
MKQCPVCAIPFTPLLLGNETEVDYCKNCKGLWFDGKEIERVHREDKVLHAVLNTTTVHPSPFRCVKCGNLNPRKAKACSVCQSELRLVCPKCAQLLNAVSIGKLQVDRCGSCRGIWLDGGELTELFREFQKVKALQKQEPSAISSGDALATAGDLTLHTLIWAPDLVFYSAAALGEIASKLPGAALDIASNMPEIAAKVAEGSGQLITGAIDLASHVPEAAGGIAELLSSFLEALLGLFD